LATSFQPTAGIASIRSGEAGAARAAAKAAAGARKGSGATDPLEDLLRSASGALEIPVLVAGEHQSFKAMAALAALVFIDRHDGLLVLGSDSISSDETRS
jgi:hypothetical protein